MMTDKKSVIRRILFIIRSVVGGSMFVAALFLSAGTFSWVEAWVFMGLFFVCGISVMRWLKKNDPPLYEERQRSRRDAKTWDKWILGIYNVFFVVLLGIAGLDAVRFRWSRVPLWIEIIAFLMYLPLWWWVFRTVVHNRFLSGIVRIQEDRSQSVCSTGPYRYVRHPMYTGILLLFLFLPLSLGSLYALIPAAVIWMLFFLRTYLEDNTLKEELPGYLEYTRNVRYRLFPKIW